MTRHFLRLAACAGLSVSLLSLGLSSVAQSQAASAPTYVMVIHGGAGTILRSRMTPAVEKAYIDTLTIALHTGYEILERGTVKIYKD
ncbi:MAG: hypothetical protein DMD63_08905 [Gemmatimonadetes bacterium]|nr:MAG: hypothetical protein DMD63_08905 [Gemmatimonadota bacterium]